MSRKGLLAAIVCILLVGAGVGFTALLRRSPSPTTETSEAIAVPALEIEENHTPELSEAEVENHRDLHLHNTGDRPVTIRLQRTDCDCTHVLVCLTSGTGSESSSKGSGKAETEGALSWQPLEMGGKEKTIPPKTEGLLRLTWKAAKVGDHVFWADLVLDDGTQQGKRRFRVPIHQVALVHACVDDDPARTDADVGRLKAGQQRAVSYLFYSQTRKHFALTAAFADTDPCIVPDTPKPLSSEQMQKLSRRFGVPLRSGYRVSVTVRERAGEERLDLGPFRRRLFWRTDIFPGHRVSGYLHGWVSGEIRLVSEDKEEGVDLGSIFPSDPKWVSFTLRSTDPTLELSVDRERTQEFLEVELLDGAKGQRKDGGTLWRARARFRSDSNFRGLFPNPEHPGYDSPAQCSAIFGVSRSAKASRASTPLPRRVFVPVRGTVERY